METTIHKTLTRPWGKETLVKVIDNGLKYNFEIPGDLTTLEIIARAEQMVTDQLERDAEDVPEEELVITKDKLKAEIDVLKKEKADLLKEISDLKKAK